MAGQRIKTYRFDALTGLDDLVLHDEVLRAPERGEVVVEIAAVSLNYRDLAVVQGNYVSSAKSGLVPCSDASGRVVAVGTDVRRFSVGDRVISTFHPRWFGGPPPPTAGTETYGSAQDGWLTEYRVVSQEALIHLPDSLSFVEGATLPCAATTAWTALSGSAPIRAGDTVLTLGSGGVSVFALQLAKAVGAAVIATTSNGQKAERLQALGASHTINYNEFPDWGERVKAGVTGGVGVDRVIEVGGPATISQSLHAVRRGGEVVLVGYLTQAGAGIDYFQLKASTATTRAVGVGNRVAAEEVARAISATGVRPVIDSVYSFADARAAFAHIESQEHFGKVVIEVGRGS